MEVEVLISLIYSICGLVCWMSLFFDLPSLIFATFSDLNIVKRCCDCYCFHLNSCLISYFIFPGDQHALVALWCSSTFSHRFVLSEFDKEEQEGEAQDNHSYKPNDSVDELEISRITVFLPVGVLRVSIVCIIFKFVISSFSNVLNSLSKLFFDITSPGAADWHIVVVSSELPRQRLIYSLQVVKQWVVFNPIDQGSFVSTLRNSLK